MTACVLYNKPKNKLRKVYEEMSKNQNFTFSMEESQKEQNVQYKLQISQRNTDTSIDMFSGEEHNATLIINQNAYYIMHGEKEYYDYNSDDIDGDIVIAGLRKTIEKDYASGREEINGKKYYYEEYDNISNFMVLLDSGENMSSKTRFYFDGSKIAYIKNIIEGNEELLKIELKYEIDENLFKIPEDYAELPME